MTDKTPQNKAENTMNIPAALPKATGTTRDSRSKSKAVPRADALKARFKAGSIPLQTDFADLIDLANMGRLAVGGAEGQPGAANGFTLSSTGRLELKPDVSGGIIVGSNGIGIKAKNGMRIDKNGLSVKVLPNYGIAVNRDGIFVQVNVKNGLTVNKDGVALKVEVNKGLHVNNSGVSVKAGSGIAVNDNGVNVKLAKGSHTNGGVGHGTDGTTMGNAGGLALSSNGLSVNAGDGIQINPRGVSIKLATSSGLSADEVNGLKIVPEQMFQKGMVMMFAGTKAEMPKGWALCDGENGRPDLRDRFIVMAGTKFTGKGDGTTSTGSTTVKGTVDVANTTLTTSQIPKHSHQVELNSFYYVAKASGSGTISSSLKVHRDGKDPNGTDIKSKTEEAGFGQGHKHTATLTTTPHSHTISAIPPYYALAFIIKN